MNTHAAITTVGEAVDFFKSQGYQVNSVDGIYRLRRPGWKKKPYEVDTETLIEQANLARNVETRLRKENT